MRIWRHVLSVLMPISPPRASISRTRWLFPGPPTAGLQGMRAILSKFSVAIRVLAPRRALARAASQPAWPAPMTMTSYVSTTNMVTPLYLPKQNRLNISSTISSWTVSPVIEPKSSQASRRSTTAQSTGIPASMESRARCRACRLWRTSSIWRVLVSRALPAVSAWTGPGTTIYLLGNPGRHPYQPTRRERDDHSLPNLFP